MNMIMQSKMASCSNCTYILQHGFHVVSHKRLLFVKLSAVTLFVHDMCIQSHPQDWR